MLALLVNSNRGALNWERTFFIWFYIFKNVSWKVFRRSSVDNASTLQSLHNTKRKMCKQNFISDSSCWNSRSISLLCRRPAHFLPLQTQMPPTRQKIYERNVCITASVHNHSLREYTSRNQPTAEWYSLLPQFRGRWMIGVVYEWLIYTISGCTLDLECCERFLMSPTTKIYFFTQVWGFHTDYHHWIHRSLISLQAKVHQLSLTSLWRHTNHKCCYPLR